MQELAWETEKLMVHAMQQTVSSESEVMDIPVQFRNRESVTTMERSFSVDDLIGGMWRLNQAAQASMGRTDSEAAFQEFLKRIPSATNLAAAAGQSLDQQQHAQFQQQVHQLQQQALQQAAAATNSQIAASTPPPISSIPTSSLPQAAAAAVAAGNLSALHRVPSLDLIRQLVVNNHGFTQAMAQPPAKPDASPAALAVGPADLAALSASTLTALQAGSLSGGVPHPLTGGLTPAAAAAAALQLGQLGQLRFGAPAQPADKESAEKAELRRARR